MGFLAHKTELDPNDRQRTALLRHAGAARWAYNFGLRRKIEAYQETGKSPTAFDLSRELVRLKHTPAADGGLPWLTECSKSVPRRALSDLDRAFANFFRRCKGGEKKKGFPRFKSRKRGIGGFKLTGAVSATATHVQLPRIGKVRLKEHGYLPTEGVKILSATVSERAGRWFVSLNVEHELPEPAPRPEHAVGVDVGISHLAVTSDGEVFDNPRALKSAERRLRLAQKSLSRKVKGSQNREKARARVARVHVRISNLRRDSLHKASTTITKSASVIVLESLNVAGMLKNRRLSKALSDASVSELHRQISYKARWQGVTVVKADRFYPSSKACSGCGVVKQALSLGDRTFRCGSCGLVVDRDLNAALNLRSLAASSAVTACRQGASTPARGHVSHGQEPTTTMRG